MTAKVITLLLIVCTLNLAWSKKHHTKRDNDKPTSAKAAKKPADPQMVKIGPIGRITEQVMQEFNGSSSQQVNAPTPNLAAKNNSPSIETSNTTEQSRSKVVEAEAKRKADDAVILKIDNLAKGVGKIYGMKEPVKTSNCEARYKPDGKESKLSLKLILDDIFKPGELPIRSASRGFIDPIKFDFKTDQQRNASLAVSFCGKQRKIKLMNFRTSNTITPVKWMTLAETSLDIVEFHYDEIINQKSDVAWNAMKIKGYGKIRLGNDGKRVNDDKYLIVFQKEMTAPKKDELIDQDMKIRIKNTAIDRYEIKASDFLAIHGKEVNDLYPKDNNMKIDCVTNEELTIEQNYGNDPIIVGSIFDKSSYSVYLTGSVKYCNDLTGSDVNIICQNDFMNIASCALLALIDTSTPKQFTAFEKSGLNNIGDFIFTDLATKTRLFDGRIPNKLLFQTSRTEFTDINDDLQDKLFPYAINNNKRDPELASQPVIIADFCFRYKLDNIGTKYPNLRNSHNIQVLVNACPTMDGVKFYLPDIGLVAIDQIPLLATSFKQEEQFRQWFKEQSLMITSIEARESDVEVGAYKFTFNLEPPAYTYARGFSFVPDFPFLKLENNPIILTRDLDPEVTLKGSGEENILTNLAKFKFEEDDTGPSITVTFGSTSSFYLLGALKAVKGFPYVFDETKNSTYVTPFKHLKTLTLPSLGTTAHAGDKSLRIVSDTFLGNESNVQFELRLSYTPDGTVIGRSCIFKTEAIVADLINAAQDSFIASSWIKSQNIGLMFLPSQAEGRTDCEMDPCCISKPMDKWSENGAKEYIGVKIQDIIVSECEKGDNSCKFLRRVANRTSVDVIMTGYMSNDSVLVSGVTENEMYLGPDIIMSGNPPINVALTVRESKTKMEDDISFTGWLTFQNNRANNLYSRIILAGDVIMFQILSGPEYMPLPNIFDSPFVRLGDSLSQRLPISANDDLKELAMNAAMKIGFDPEYQLVFDDANSVSITIDGKTGKASRFYACRRSEKPVPIRDVLNAFNGINVFGLLDKTEIKGLCVTYHQGKSNWNITALGLDAKPGLRISGLLVSRYGGRHSKEGNFNLKADMDLNIENTYSEFCVVLPTLEWGGQVRNVDGNKVETSMMKMMYSKKAETEGPLYCLRLPKQKGAATVAYMKGYLKTFAFEAPAIVNIGSTDPRSSGNLFHYTFDYSGKLFNEINGRLRLEADYSEQDPFKINFKISIDQVTLQDLPKSVSDYTDTIVNLGTKIKEKVEGYFGKFSKWVKAVKGGMTKIKDILKKQTKEFSKTKIDRARAIRAIKKDCTRECGYVRVPGFKVENQCGKSSNGNSLRCLNYVDDAHIAGNVGCVASCEAERVKASVNAAKLDDIARTEGSNVDTNRRCFTIARKLKSTLQIMKNFFKDKKEKLKTRVDKFKSLKNLDTKKFNILNLRMTAAVDKIKDAMCFQFNWEGIWDWNRKADKELDVSKRRQIFTNITRCFNGFFVKNITEYIMSKRYVVNDMTKLEREALTLEGKYLTFDKIINKTGGNSKSRDINKIEGEFDKCVNGTAQKSTLKRSVIDTMTPIKGGMFTIFHPGTLDAFNERSPWEVSSKKDALQGFAVSERKDSIRNSTLAGTDSTCSMAMRAAIDYGDIGNYIHRWIKEQKTAKETYATVKSTINKELKNSEKTLSGLQSNLSTDADGLLRFWQDKAKTGMEKWLSSEETRISKHNRESIPLIRKELEFIYTTKEYPTLKDFFNRRGLEGSNALKKANIATPNGNSFSDLSQSLLNVLQSGKNLDQLASPVEEVMHRIEGLHKRTILCTP